MSGTATEKEETSSDNNYQEDASWLFDQIDISGATQFGEDFYMKRPKLCL